MRQTGFTILSCFLLGFAFSAAGLASKVSALKILDKYFDTQTQQLGYELWNGSDRTITAWRLSLARSDPHGHARRSILDQDFYHRQPEIELGAKAGPLAPGASVAAQWRLDKGEEEAGPTALSLEVRAVVFDDLTWEGDPDAASVLLAARSARVEEFGKALAALEKQDRRLWSGQEWMAELRQKAQLLKQQASDPESAAGSRREVAAVVAATKLELARWLEDASREISLSPNPDEALDLLTAGLREHFEAGLQITIGDEQAPGSDASERRGER